MATYVIYFTAQHPTHLVPKQETSLKSLLPFGASMDTAFITKCTECNTFAILAHIAKKNKAQCGQAAPPKTPKSTTGYLRPALLACFLPSPMIGSGIPEKAEGLMGVSSLGRGHMLRSLLHPAIAAPRELNFPVSSQHLR